MCGPHVGSTRSKAHNRVTSSGNEPDVCFQGINNQTSERDNDWSEECVIAVTSLIAIELPGVSF